MDKDHPLYTKPLEDMTYEEFNIIRWSFVYPTAIRQLVNTELQRLKEQRSGSTQGT